MTDSFGARQSLTVGDAEYRIYSLDALGERARRLPYTLKILLENLLRHEDGVNITAEDIEALAGWDPAAEPAREISFTPARVILQDFTGVPAVVDLAAMRDAVVKLGGNASSINPLSPAELVIDHSVQVDAYGTPQALSVNNAIEFERNRERYAFLRWGQNAFRNFRVVPPNTGIVHQVNLEYLSRVVFDAECTRQASEVDRDRRSHEISRSQKPGDGTRASLSIGAGKARGPVRMADRREWSI
jgi:aconitate hydratase